MRCGKYNENIYFLFFAVCCFVQDGFFLKEFAENKIVFWAIAIAYRVRGKKKTSHLYCHVNFGEEDESIWSSVWFLWMKCTYSVPNSYTQKLWMKIQRKLDIGNEVGQMM